MSEMRLDCQGLACPQPVLRCKEAIDRERPERILVQVDNPGSAENVRRFLTSQGYVVEGTESEGRMMTIRAALDPEAPTVQSDRATAAFTCPAPAAGKTLVFLTSDTIGHGNEELGGRLMVNYLGTLREMSSLWRIILVNGAVRLAVNNNPTVEHLRALHSQGVSILVCGTCLDFFGLLESKAVGETTNMLDVVTSLETADRVITV